MVYRGGRYDPKIDETVPASIMAEPAMLKFAALTPIDGTGIEVDESELDENGFHHPKPKS
jgi:hypothetical protein